MSRPRAYQLIGAAEVTASLSTTVDTPPNERQARELVPLKADEREVVAAWREAKDAAVAELSKEGLSTRKIGEVLGVAKDTVRNDLAGEISPPTAEKQATIEVGAGEKSPPNLTATAKTQTRRQRDAKAAAKREDKAPSPAISSSLAAALTALSIRSASGARRVLLAVRLLPSLRRPVVDLAQLRAGQADDLLRLEAEHALVTAA